MHDGLKDRVHQVGLLEPDLDLLFLVVPTECVMSTYESPDAPTTDLIVEILIIESTMPSQLQTSNSKNPLLKLPMPPTADLKVGVATYEAHYAPIGNFRSPSGHP